MIVKRIFSVSMAATLLALGGVQAYAASKSSLPTYSGNRDDLIRDIIQGLMNSPLPPRPANEEPRAKGVGAQNGEESEVIVKRPYVGNARERNSRWRLRKQREKEAAAQAAQEGNTKNGGRFPGVEEPPREAAEFRGTEVPADAPELFPRLKGALQHVSLISTNREYLAGSTVVGTAAGVIAASQAFRYLRAFAGAATRSPALAAFFFPDPQAATLTININEMGISAGDARAFFQADPAEQRSLCELSAYRPFCSKLQSLEFEIAYSEGRGA